jgi:hypothetical protein
MNKEQMQWAAAKMRAADDRTLTNTGIRLPKIFQISSRNTSLLLRHSIIVMLTNSYINHFKITDYRILIESRSRLEPLCVEIYFTTELISLSVLEHTTIFAT